MTPNEIINNALAGKYITGFKFNSDRDEQVVKHIKQFIGKQIEHAEIGTLHVDMDTEDFEVGIWVSILFHSNIFIYLNETIEIQSNNPKG